MRRSGREKTNGLRTSQRTSRVETTKPRVCRVDCRAGEAQSLVSGTGESNQAGLMIHDSALRPRL